MENLILHLQDFNNPYLIYALILGVLILCGFGVPIPEDIILGVTGVLVFEGAIELVPSIVVAMFGVMAGDSAMYFLGSKLGRRATQHFLFKRIITDERLAKIQKKLHDHGPKIMFSARFMPGMRSVFFFSAGMLHLPFRVFAFFDGMAAFISVPTIIYICYHFGDEIERVFKVIRKVEHGILFVILAVALIAIFKWYRARHNTES